MIVAKLIKVDSSGYMYLRRIFAPLDSLMPFKPGLWVGLWCLILSGTNVAKGVQDRWFYWDFSTLSITLIGVMFLAIVWTYLLHRFPVLPNKVISLKSGLITAGFGFVLFIAGTIPVGFDMANIILGIPYLAMFMAIWIVFGIPIIEDGKGEKSVLPKKDFIMSLSIALVFVGLAVFMGFFMDDPMVSTIAVVYIPFLLVALIFSAHVRHIQRARIYGLFIPAIFLCVRFPWFMVPVALVFWGLRFYNYFRHGKIHPTFKVDWKEEN